MTARSFRLLLTGFGPFAGDDHNPSGVIAEALDAERFSRRDGATVSVRGVTLPVSSARLSALLLPLLDGADAALGLGVAVGRTRVTLERFAYNEKTFRSPDVDGACPDGALIDRDGPDRVESSLGLEHIARVWKAAGVPAAPSDDPGRHLCNQWLYTMRTMRPALPAGFLHVPADARLAMEREVAWVPIDDSRRAVRLALDAIAETL